MRTSREIWILFLFIILITIWTWDFVLMLLRSVLATFCTKYIYHLIVL